MHSANGRVKKDVASVKNGNKKIVVACLDCGHKMPEKTIEFGEENKCESCGSQDLVNRWE